MIDRTASSTILGRLYIQSNEITSRILADINPDDMDFGPVLSSLRAEEIQIFTSLEEIEQFTKAVKERLKACCAALDPLFCIPVLIDTFSGFYAKMATTQSNSAVIACKLVMSFVWSGTYEPVPANLRSYNALSDSLKIAMLLANLDQVVNIWKFSGSGKVEVNSNGVFALESFATHAVNFNLLGAHEFKILNAAAELIWMDENSFAKIQNIVTGKVKPGERLFGNSFLSEIPFQEKVFWANLWCKLRVYLLIIKERHTVAGKSYEGLCLLSENVRLIKEQPGGILRSINDKNIWEPLWHQAKMEDEISEIKRMVVDRPLIRVYTSEPVYATSIAFLWDAVNVQLEEFVHSRKGDKFYERYFSGPFEARTWDLFRKYGFECGEVNTNSMWKRENPLRLNTAEMMPGQIDMLAILEKHRLLIVADCKMVHFPYKLSAQKNLLGKFGVADDESFFKKLDRKTEWLSTCSNFNMKEYTVLKILITNINIPIPIDEEHLVLSIAEIEERLLKNL